MEVDLQSDVPATWKSRRPVDEYETTLLYTGFSRYDTRKKVLSQLQKTPDGRLVYTSRPWEGVLSRCYNAELVRITVYSTEPAVWSETVQPGEVHFFQQKQPA